MQVNHVSLIKSAAEKTAPRYGALRAVHTNKNGVWSVVDSSAKDGQDSLYLKQAKGNSSTTRTTGDRGLVRFETRLKSRRLTKFGLTTLASIDQQACWNALESRWIGSRHGKPFRAGGSLAGVFDAFDPHTRAKVLALMTALEHGLPPEENRRTVQKYVKQARDAGLVPGVPLAQQGGELRYVDLQSGRDLPA